MRTVEPILLTGDYDWDEGLIPTAEYTERLKAVRAALAEKGCAGLILEGDAEDHASLAYLTGYAPKLGRSGVALIPLDGPVQLYFTGAPPMTPAARRQSWVRDIKALGDAKAIITEWLAPIPAGRPIAFAGSRVLRTGFQRMFSEAVGPSRGVVRLEQRLDQLRRKKSVREREILRRATLVLESTVDAFVGSFRGGAGARTAHVAAERAAHRAGAQDVRVMASAENGGTPWPFDRPDDLRPDPMLVHIAVRFAGYWSEALFTLGRKTNAGETAARTLDSLIRGARPGATVTSLARGCAERIVPFRLHPYVEGCFGYGIGLFPEEAPRLAFGVNETFQEGDVLALRVGLAGAGGDNGFASAMVELNETGPVVLWSSAKLR